MKIKTFGAALVAFTLAGAAGSVQVLADNDAMEVVHEDGLIVKDLVVGEGEEAVLHSAVKVHYTGRLMDGTKFDSSLDRNEPFGFNIGFQQVIQGWERGVVGMRVGGKRELTIPPELAYGERGAGDAIPGNATLKFEIELLAVEGPGYANVDGGTLQGMMKDGAKVVDIRHASEWQQTGVIDGATLLTAYAGSGQLRQEFPSEFEAAVAREDTVVVVGSNADDRAPVLALILVRRAGYPTVFNLEGGIENWKEDGLAVIDPPAAPEKPAADAAAEPAQ